MCLHDPNRVQESFDLALQADGALGAAKHVSEMKVHVKPSYMDLGATRRHPQQRQTPGSREEVKPQRRKGMRLDNCNVYGQRGHWATECLMKKGRSSK